jgi:hypothetical protein
MPKKLVDDPLTAMKRSPAEVHDRHRGHLSGQHAPHQSGRAGDPVAQLGAEDSGGDDDRQLDVSVGAGVVPGRALGQDL